MMTRSAAKPANTTMDAKEKLIVALDVDTAERAWQLFTMLRDTVGMFKIGSQLFTAAGPGVVREIISAGGRIFLDLKFHDIPNTVAAAAVEAARLGVSILNIHAAGGLEMMKRAAEAVADVADRERLRKPAVIAVTVLTSMDREGLLEVGFADEPRVAVRNLARLTLAAGLDGVVASAEEIGIIRETISRPDFLIVTPGIRPANGSEAYDQRRVKTPAEAMRAGADFLVVGRPVIGAADPLAAAKAVVAEMASVT